MPSLRTRSIFPDPRGPGVSSSALSQQVQAQQPGQFPLASYRGQHTKLITLVGSSPRDLGSFGFLPFATIARLRARLDYRSGGISRSDTWAWNIGGWTRTVLANEAFVTVEVTGATALTSAITIGAGVSEHASTFDSLVTGVSDPALSAMPRAQLCPNGAREFKVVDGIQAGTWELGWLDQDGTFSVAFGPVGTSTWADWTPFPNVCNAIRYTRGALGTTLAGLAFVHWRAI